MKNEPQPIQKAKPGAKPGNTNARKEKTRKPLRAMIDAGTLATIEAIKAQTNLSQGKIVDEAIALLKQKYPSS